eukprot:7386601-Prymnesium_polylepis.2
MNTAARQQVPRHDPLSSARTAAEGGNTPIEMDGEQALREQQHECNSDGADTWRQLVVSWREKTRLRTTSYRAAVSS